MLAVRAESGSITGDDAFEAPLALHEHPHHQIGIRLGVHDAKFTLRTCDEGAEPCVAALL